MNQMATRFLSTLALFLLPLLAFSQIPNGGFEDWTTGDPDGWATSNIVGMITPVTRVTSPHSGTYALYGEAKAFYTAIIGPTIQSGADATGFPYSQRPAVFTGWYKFAPQGGDRFGVNVGLFKGGVEGINVAIAAIAPSVAVGSWTQFSASFVYQTSDIPDVCVVQIQIVGSAPPTYMPTVGSSYYLDDIALSGTTSAPIAHEVIPSAFVLHQNYPNPFNPTTTIGYDLPTTSNVKLNVFDILGREVSTLVDGMESAGKHVVRFDGSNLPSGFYFYKLQAAGYTNTRRMMLVK
jgi:hypothetical protein